MLKSWFAATGVCTAVITGVLGIPSVYAVASSAPSTNQIVINHTATGKNYGSSLMVQRQQRNLYFPACVPRNHRTLGIPDHPCPVYDHHLQRSRAWYDVDAEREGHASDA